MTNDAQGMYMRGSAAQHTPGPWRAFNHSWCETSVLADGFDHAVCLLDINHATEESQEADAALMAANARLIAAAPELLEALQTLVLNYRNGYGEKPINAAAIEAAIAKATGSTS